jgi:parallel beta-helix repeat protein
MKVNYVKKINASLITMAMLLSILSATVFFAMPVAANDSGKVFSTIQEAINDANEGDTITVPAGIYYENIIINKSISLLGEDKDTTIIDGSGVGYVVYISADNVLISDFTIQNSSLAVSDDEKISGVHLNSVSNVGVTCNIINKNYIGISFNSSSNNTIKDNEIKNNSYYGIYLMSSSDNNIYHNNLMNNTEENAYDNGNNTWYNEDLEQGNYYDDYMDKYPNATANGVWDTPYNITGGDNQDLYPLVGYYEPPEEDPDPEEPKLEVYIHMGPFRVIRRGKVNATVENTGNVTVNNVNLTVFIEYGFIGRNKVNKSVENVSLQPGESMSVEIDGLSGFRFIKINATAVSDEAEDVTVDLTGRIMGRLIFIFKYRPIVNI